MDIHDWATSRWNHWIHKRIPRALETTLNQRQLFIFPTRAGMALVGLLLVLLLIAINYENNLVYGLVFLLATILVITVHVTFANLYRVTISGARNEPVFPGEYGAVAIKLVARSRPRYDISFITSHRSHLLPEVQENDPASLNITVKPDKRGLFSLGRLRVESDYPFGLVRCWSWVDISQPLWVYPKPLTPLTLAPQNAEGASALVTSPSQRGDDLYAFNAYRPGDPIKHIHWPSVARGTEPQVTVMAAPSSDSSLTIDFDDYPGVDLEKRLSWLCSRVLVASRDNRSYSLVLPSARIGPNAGEHHRDEALMMLAQFDQNLE
jgi:uncharacterized protein (DUF58 family)